MPDLALRTSPSVLFDARYCAIEGPDGDKKLSGRSQCRRFPNGCKPSFARLLGFAGIPSLAKQSGTLEAPGIVNITIKAGIKRFIDAARAGRFWEREVD